jgi:hypothetical protein
MVARPLLRAVSFVVLALAACTSAQVPEANAPLFSAPQPVLTSADDVVAAPPEWAVGDRWVFRKRVGLWKGQFTREVVETSMSGYLVRVEGRDPWPFVRFSHMTTQLEVIGWTEDGQITRAFSPPLPLFQWPLRPGLQWTPQTAGGPT